MVLGLEARDHEVVLARGDADLGQPGGVRGHDRGAIGDVAGVDAVHVSQVIGDPLGISDDGIGPAGAASLRPTVVARCPDAPLGALPLEPVDMYCHGDPGCAKGGEEGRVRGVEDDRDIGMLPGDRMPDGQARVAQGLGRPVAYGGEVDQSHAEELGLGLAGVAAVDHHVVAALHEPAADLLRGGLEAAVPRGHTAGPEQGDAHQPTVRCTGRSRFPDHSRPAPDSVHPGVAGRVIPGAGWTLTFSSAGWANACGSAWTS